MDTVNKEERIAFMLFGLNYLEVAKVKVVTWADLEHAPIGTIFTSNLHDTTGRGVCDEDAKLKFKDHRGFGIEHRCWGTTDDPDPERWENEVTLRWFKFD